MFAVTVTSSKSFAVKIYMILTWPKSSVNMRIKNSCMTMIMAPAILCEHRII